jgi:hypothetical protein
MRGRGDVEMGLVELVGVGVGVVASGCGCGLWWMVDVGFRGIPLRFGGRGSVFVFCL